MTTYPTDQGVDGGAIPVRIAGASAGSSAKVTPTAASASTVATGGTAVTVASGPINGGVVANPSTATEVLFISLVTASPATTTAGGAIFALAAGQVWNLPALASGVTVTANAATSGHVFSAVVW